MRIAYTLEQCWHRVPGGTGIAAIEVAKELVCIENLSVVGVVGRHRRPPAEGFVPPVKVATLPLGGPYLYEAWLRLGWPKVESVVDGADLVHSTTIIPPATELPLVSTIHDLAFLEHPEFFTDRGNRVFRKSLEILQRKAALLLCSSQATADHCVRAGFSPHVIRHVPLGVTVHQVTEADKQRVRNTYSLPNEFILFVGTREPRKNLSRLIASLESVRHAPPLVIVGMNGWGDSPETTSHDVRFTGFVPSTDLPALYSLCSVFAFPSVLEGYGLPVLEAMAHGAPVVTSEGTSTEEVAGGAAVLVNPLDVSSIAHGITHALARRDELCIAGRQRAVQLPWSKTAQLTAEAYGEVIR